MPRKKGQHVRREEILRVAAHLFRDYGYHGTSIHDLANAVGLQKASLYHHIGSKEELLQEILMTGMRSIIARLEEIIRDPSLSNTEKLRRALMAQVEAVTGDEAFVQTAVITDGRLLPVSFREEYIAARDTFERQVRSIIAAGVQAGEFRPYDVGLITKAILGMIGWLVIWYRPYGPLSPAEIAERFWEFILHGLSRGPDAGQGQARE